MAKSLESIIGYVALLEAIETILKGIPDPLPAGFASITEETVADKARYVVTTGTRQTARQTQYGAPARKRQLRNIGDQNVVLIHSFEEINFSPYVLMQLRNYEDYTQQRMGEEEVARQVGNFVELFNNLRIAVRIMMLHNGKLWFDAEGNLLPSSSGSAFSAGAQRSANNENQLNGLVTVPWNQQQADIPGDLRKLKIQSAKDTGFQLKYALYGKSLPDYLTQNDYVIDYLSRNPTWSDKWNSTGDIPDGLFGFTWIPMYTSFFDDQNEAHQEIWDADTVVFTPQPDKRWWSNILGSYPVPTTINVQTNAEQAISSLKVLHGMFGYSYVTMNPVGISSFMGDTIFPALKNPAATYALKSVF